ncbi:IS110 family transposase [Photobacterium damselae]|uniref:IS110 family transposase n=1 Tax=Photobacterium damselae TaxID=38293 RepID=UPI0039C142EC
MSNPGKAHKFSQSLGLVHKTDESDSYMLALYGDAQRERTQIWTSDNLNTRNIRSLVRRLSALEKDRLRESNRLEASEISDANERVKISIMRIVSVIDEEIASIEQEIELAINSDADMARNHKLLQSVVGIGKVMSRELVLLSHRAENCSRASRASSSVVDW